MDSASRSGRKPECISAAIERAKARATGSAGQSCFSGKSSARYSPIASESQILISAPSRLWTSSGTFPVGEICGEPLLVLRLAVADQRLLEGDAGLLQRQPGAQRPGRDVVIADVDAEVGHGSVSLEADQRVDLDVCLARPFGAAEIGQVDDEGGGDRARRPSGGSARLPPPPCRRWRSGRRSAARGSPLWIASAWISMVSTPYSRL